MKNFLSLDWNYFIAATCQERQLLFPGSGTGNPANSHSPINWQSYYQNSRLQTLHITDNFSFLLQFCQSFDGAYLVADSHRSIFPFIMDSTLLKEELAVYNLDFCHDLHLHYTPEERVNYGNWVSILLDERPQCHYYWIAREDSTPITSADASSAHARIHRLSFDQLLGAAATPLDFDFVFLCRSSPCTPPHLDNYFVQLLDALSLHASGDVRDNVEIPRSLLLS